MLVGLAACAPAPAQPSGGGASSPPASASPSPSPSPEPVEPTIVEVPASTVGQVTQLSLNAPDQGVTAEVPRFEAARNLSVAVEVVRGRMLRQASWDKADSAATTARVTAAGADVVGVELTSTVTAGAVTTVTPSAIWYDANSGLSYAPAALIDPTAWSGFVTAVSGGATEAGADAAKASESLNDQAAPYGTGPAIGLSPEGALVVSFATGVVGTERVDVTVPAEQAEPMLSAFGQQALTAVAKPAALAATAAGTPDPTLADAGGRAPVKIGPDCMVLKCVALTFDDGPGAGTPDVQDALAKGKAGATFFVLGENTESNPKTVLRGAALGMELASHSMKHPDLARQSAARLDKEIVGTNDVLRQTIGESPLLMRPPYGSHNPAVDKVAAANGLAIVQWSVDTLDWKTRSTPSTISSATSLGGYNLPIVLMHDIHDSTVNAVPSIVSDLTDAGYTLVTVSEQSLNEGTMLAGHAYCHGLGVSQAGFNCKG